MLGFLKSLLQNAALALALFATASLLWSLVDLSFDSSAMGFPFSFYVRWGPCPHGLNCATFYKVPIFFFGTAYEEYLKQVPRWIPKFK